MYAERTQERPEDISENNVILRLMTFEENGLLTPDNKRIARSLMREWSAHGLTDRQQQLAYGICMTVWNETNGGPESEKPERIIKPWWHDLTSQRQAIRGLKRQAILRKELTPRNRRIHALRQKGTPIQVLANTFRLSTRQIMRIIKQVSTGIYDISRRKVAPLDSLYVKFRPFLSSFVRDTCHLESTHFAPPAALPSSCRGRSNRIFTSLTRWLGLRSTRNASFDAVIREAQRLNGLESRPLKPPAVRRAARNAWTASRRWVTA